MKQPTHFTVGPVYWLAGCERANALYCRSCLLVSRMSNSQHIIVGPVYWLAGCETANRFYCQSCLLVSRKSNSQHTLLSVLFTLANKQEVPLVFKPCAVAHQISHNIKLLCSVVCSWNYSQNNKQLTFSWTLNTIDVTRRSEQLKKNGWILCRSVGAVCYLVDREFAFRGHGGLCTAVNRPHCAVLLNGLRNPVALLENYLNSANVI